MPIANPLRCSRPCVKCCNGRDCQCVPVPRPASIPSNGSVWTWRSVSVNKHSAFSALRGGAPCGGWTCTPYWPARVAVAGHSSNRNALDHTSRDYKSRLKKWAVLVSSEISALHFLPTLGGVAAGSFLDALSCSCVVPISVSIFT